MIEIEGDQKSIEEKLSNARSSLEETKKAIASVKRRL